ncbi:MAG: hypothetical protein K1X88_01265 [Nannocystaceae bacterium]|nr:hypothetical protein [Nannocystaceae bacterium]
MLAIRPASFVHRHVAADVSRREGLAIALGSGATAYLWLWFPPQELRAALLGLAPPLRAMVIVALVAAWLAVTHGLAHRVLASHEVAMLRHLPISAARWRAIHMRHLLALDLPLHAAVIYVLAPSWSSSPWWCGALASLAVVLAATLRLVAAASADRGAWARAAAIGLPLALLCDALAQRRLAVIAPAALLGLVWSLARVGRPLPEARTARVAAPRRAAAGPTRALARLLRQLAWRSDRGAIVGVAIAQTGFAAAGALGAAHVGGDDGRGAAAAIQTMASFGAGLGLWLALRNERRLQSQHWALDACTGARRLDLPARAIAASGFAAPLLLATLAAAASGLHPRPLLALATALAVCVWLGAAAPSLAIAAQRRDRLAQPQVVAAALHTAALGLALHQGGAAAALLLAALLLAHAWTRWPAATSARRRRTPLVPEADRG